MSYRDSERFRKVYSYFRPVPRPTDNTYGSGVTKDYVDDLFNSLDWKQSVQYASDKNVDLTAVHKLVNDVDSAFLGGQLLVDEDRVLLRAQTNPAENGLYIWYTATSKFVRTLDSAQDSITCGATCYVDTGSFGGQVWLMESVDPITVDTSPQVWTMLVSLSGSANDVVQYFTSSLAGYVSTTGSMSFNGGDASVNETWNVGSDVFFYVSGTKGLDGSAGKVSVFGGDMVVSGNIDITDGNVEITGSLYVSGVFDIMADTIEVTGTVYATQGFSGSLTNLTDGTSFIAAGDNITVTSASNGQITITGMSSAPMLWTEVSPVVGSPGAISTTSSVVIGQFSTSSFGTDVMFYVTSSFGSPRQASVFMGDVVVSGNLGLGGDRLEITGSLDVSGAFNVSGSTFSVNSTSLTMTSYVVKVTGTVASTLGFSGSLTNLTDGTSYLVAGENVSVVSQSNGQVIVSCPNIGTLSRITPADSYTTILWPLSESTEPFANSGSGGSLSLTKDPDKTDPTTAVTGLFGKTCYFNNTTLTSSYTSIGEPSGQAMTVSAWVTPTTLQNSFIVLKPSGSAWLDPYMMFCLEIVNSSGDWGTFLYTDVKTTYSLLTVTNQAFVLRQNKTTLLSVTYDGSYLRMYYDGALAKEEAWTGNVLGGEHRDWEIGGYHVGGQSGANFVGTIEDIRIEDTCRSQAYLETQYRAGMARWLTTW